MLRAKSRPKGSQPPPWKQQGKCGLPALILAQSGARPHGGIFKHDNGGLANRPPPADLHCLSSCKDQRAHSQSQGARRTRRSRHGSHDLSSFGQPPYSKSVANAIFGRKVRRGKTVSKMMHLRARARPEPFWIPCLAPADHGCPNERVHEASTKPEGSSPPPCQKRG